MRLSSLLCVHQPVDLSDRRFRTPTASTPSPPFHLCYSLVYFVAATMRHIAAGWAVWRKSVPQQHSDSYWLDWPLRSDGVPTQFNSSSFKTADFWMMLNLNFGFRLRVSARNFCANFPHFLLAILVINCYCCCDWGPRLVVVCPQLRYLHHDSLPKCSWCAVLWLPANRAAGSLLMPLHNWLKQALRSSGGALIFIISHCFDMICKVNVAAVGAVEAS